MPTDLGRGHSMRNFLGNCATAATALLMALATVHRSRKPDLTRGGVPRAYVPLKGGGRLRKPPVESWSGRCNSELHAPLEPADSLAVRERTMLSLSMPNS